MTSCYNGVTELVEESGSKMGAKRDESVKTGHGLREINTGFAQNLTSLCNFPRIYIANGQ